MCDCDSTVAGPKCQKPKDAIIIKYTSISTKSYLNNYVCRGLLNTGAIYYGNDDGSVLWVDNNTGYAPDLHDVKLICIMYIFAHARRLPQVGIVV